MIYAQAPTTAPNTEDELLESFFGSKADGYFVDIGAHDGVSYSNVRKLWTKGWSGTLIEPDPNTYQLLLANYPSKRGLRFVNAAVCLKNGPVKFTGHRDSERTGWHSMAPEWISTWEPGKAFQITVPGVRLDSLSLPSQIDLLSVDTEGYDAVILESMPESMRPSLIICEVDKNGVRPRVEAEMLRRRYRFIWGTYLNSAYAASI